MSSWIGETEQSVLCYSFSLLSHCRLPIKHEERLCYGAESQGVLLHTRQGVHHCESVCSLAGLADCRAGPTDSRAGTTDCRAGSADRRAGLADRRAGHAISAGTPGYPSLCASLCGSPTFSFLISMTQNVYFKSYRPARLDVHESGTIG